MTIGRLVANVAVGKKELRRAFDPGALLTNLVDFAFPATPEAGHDLVLACQCPPRG